MKNTKNHKSSLYEIINGRKEISSADLKREISETFENERSHIKETMANLVKKVYSSGDVKKIEDFETRLEQMKNGDYGKSIDKFYKFLHLFNEDSKTEKEMAGYDRSKKLVSARGYDKRKRLTFYQYSKSRDRGMSNEEIKKKFRMNTPYQICGFARHYVKDSRKN